MSEVSVIPDITIVHEPLSSSDEDIGQDCSSSHERNDAPIIPVIDLSSDPKPVKPKTYPEKSHRDIPVPTRKRKSPKESPIKANTSNVIEILG